MPVIDINGRRLLYIHVPKVGGTSVTEFLSRHGAVIFDESMTIYQKKFRPRHLHAEHLKQIYLPDMFDYVFMVVRNPVEKLVSEYRYQRRKSGLHWQSATNFQSWLRYSLWRSSNSPSYRENHFRPQSEFACFNCEIFKLEDGHGQLTKRLAEIAGILPAETVDQLNKSPRKDYLISKQSIDIIHNRYSDDFNNFGYSMNDG
ncbi:MAG: sulfotransferase family protein [Marinosulfonomonas sp.]|nr:sulfotransferase family protein [Marinosulfonomonas sp.]